MICKAVCKEYITQNSIPSVCIRGAYEVHSHHSFCRGRALMVDQYGDK